ncbi:MAG TPA: SIMPL domain-containing protein [Stellaceae bacterium]|nr:SIMPL domain-containing protein [Stellaceae bacterium]
MAHRTAGVPPAKQARGPRSRLIATVVALCIPTSAFAQDVERPATVLHLSQTAERSVVRDLLRIELRVEAFGADAVTVQSDINQRMASALDRARQVPGVKVETGFYNVGEERPQNGPPRWRGGQSVILTGKDAASMLKLAGQLQSDGLSTSSLGYETSPETLRGAEDDLTAEALAELGHRAATIADQMHLTVLRYRELRIGNAETGGRPVPRIAAMAAAAPVAEPGEAVIRVTVEGDILLVRGSSP